MTFSNNRKFKLGQWVRIITSGVCGKIIQIGAEKHATGDTIYFITGKPAHRNLMMAAESNLEIMTDEEVMLWKLQN